MVYPMPRMVSCQLCEKIWSFLKNQICSYASSRNFILFLNYASARLPFRWFPKVF